MPSIIEVTAMPLVLAGLLKTNTPPQLWHIVAFSRFSDPHF
jgi:hypothetical protein